jgi:hypothetical protein
VSADLTDIITRCGSIDSDGAFDLPPGETLLWTGQPKPFGFVYRAFHLKALAAYFALIVGFTTVGTLASDTEAYVLLGSLAWQLSMGAAVLLIFSLLGHFYAKSTIYALTNKRFVIRSGLALPSVIAIPITKIQSAGIQMYSDKTGDIVLVPEKGLKVYWLLLWPSVRTFEWSRVQPMLRAIEKPEVVAEMLRNLVAIETEAKVPALTEESRPMPEPTSLSQVLL